MFEIVEEEKGYAKKWKCLIILNTFEGQDSYISKYLCSEKKIVKLS